MRAQRAGRVAGCSAAVSVALIGGGLALAYADRHLVPARLAGWTLSDVSGQVVNLAVPVAGFVLASRRPANRIGWLFLVAGLALGLFGFSDQYALRALVVSRGSLPAGQVFGWLSNWVWVIQTAVLAYVFLLFPTGKLSSRRWRPAAWFVGGAFAALAVEALAMATRYWADPFSNPAQSTSAPAVLLILVPASLLVSVAGLVVRFARSSGEERLQLKWFAAAALLVVATFIASIVGSSAAASVPRSLAFACLWTAITIAVLKYRLYAIDRIISRTLAYAVVTGVLAGLYAGLVLLATRVLSISSPVAVAASTLAAAALFNPLRQRVQKLVDRRFNRVRYDADQAVAAFAGRLKDAVDLDAVRADLLAVVHAALEPAQVSVWISQHD